MKAGPGGLLALLVASSLAGCFDVHATDLLVIDNFNDGDLQPLDPGFGVWDCQTINSPSTPKASCAVSTDTNDQSAYSILLHVLALDPADGLQQHGGASVATGATMGAVDFTHYKHIAFDIKLVPGGTNPLPLNGLVYLELACSTVRPESMDMRQDVYVSQGVPYSSTWHNVALSLINFGSPPWLVEPIDGGPGACLRHVDGVRFSIDAQLPDGQSGDGFLYLDNIVLE